jgi:hypothetical protein
MVQGAGEVRIPAEGLPEIHEVVVEGPTPGSRGVVIESRHADAQLRIQVPLDAAGRWLWALPKP